MAPRRKIGARTLANSLVRRMRKDMDATESQVSLSVPVKASARRE
jgi:hypothetical protein